VISLIGNHELMNLNGVFSYTTTQVTARARAGAVLHQATS
jgi:hypothetical protein